MVRRQKKSEESEFEVQEIVSHRTIKGRREYKIRWKGYSASEDTWEVEDNLNCHNLIEEYTANLENNEALEDGESKSSSSRKRKNGRGDATAEENSKDKNEGDEQPAGKTPKKMPRQPKEEKSAKGTKSKEDGEGTPSRGSRRSLRSPPAKKEAETPQPTKKNRKKQTPEKKTSRKTKEKEYEVEKIEKMKIGRNGKRTFLVHWVGYDESDATWEPEDHLKGTDLLEKFLKTQE